MLLACVFIYFFQFLRTQIVFLFFFLFPVSSQVPALESVEQGGVSNHTEAAIIHKLLSLLIKVHQETVSFSVSQ